MIRATPWICNGLKKPEKLLHFLKNTFANMKKNSLYMACIQDKKLNTLTNDHKIVIKNYGLEYHFQPATNGSGGLLTLWNHKEASNLIATNETCLVTEFPQQSSFLVNTYIRTIDYKLFATTAQLPTSSKIVLLGDLNSYKDPMKDRIGNKIGPVDNHKKKFKKRIKYRHT